MGTEIITEVARPGLPASSPKLAPRVALAVQSKTEFRFTPEDDDGNPKRAGGAAAHEVAWDIPTVITQSLITDAASHLPAWREYMKAAAPHIVAEWLARLGVMCGGPKMTLDEAKEKIAAYAMGLRHPAFCFSEASLYAAAKKFKWFPTYSEVSDWLDAKSREARNTLQRLEMLAGAKPSKPREPDMVRKVEDATPEQRAQHLEAMRALKTRLAAQGVGNTPEAQKARRAVDNRIAQQRAAMAPMIEAARARFLEEAREGE